MSYIKHLFHYNVSKVKQGHRQKVSDLSEDVIQIEKVKYSINGNLCGEFYK